MADDFIEMKLNLSPEEAMKRLREHPQMIDVPSFLFSFFDGWNGSNGKTIVGAFKNSGFILRKRHFYYSNGLQPIIDGHIEPAEGGSKLTARFRRLHSVVWLVWGMILVYLIIGLYLLSSAGYNDMIHRGTHQPYGPNDDLIIGLIMLGTVIFVFFINFFARWLGDKDRPYVREFIHTLYADVRRS